MLFQINSRGAQAQPRFYTEIRDREQRNTQVSFRGGLEARAQAKAASSLIRITVGALPFNNG
jgi:hypothetical protein